MRMLSLSIFAHTCRTMSQILGIPTSNRQSAPSFARIGENYRKANTMQELAIHVCRPLMTFFYAGFLNIIPWLILSAFSPGYQTINRPIDKDFFYALDTFMVPDHYLVFVTSAQLPSDQAKKLNLVERTPGGKHKWGYITTKRMAVTKVVDLWKQIKKLGVDVETSQGISGSGFTINAVKSILAIGRIVRAFLLAQPGSPSSTPLTSSSIFKAETVVVSTSSTVTAPQWDENDSTVFLVPDDGSFVDDDSCSFVRRESTRAIQEVFVKVDTISEAGPAHLFRYVPYTLPADTTFYASLVYKHFSHLFAPDSKAAKSIIEGLVNPIGYLSTVAEGNQLLFILYVISLTIDCGGFLQVVMDGDILLGCAMFTGQHLWRGEYLVAPVDADSIRTTVSQWITSTKARSVVAGFLSELPTTAGGKSTINEGHISTPKDLVKEIMRRTRPVALLDEVRNVLPYLGYSFDFLEASSKNIASILANIHHSSLPENFAITEHIFLYANCYIVANLSSFGTRSISLMNVGGKMIDIYVDAKDDPNNKATKKVIKQTLGTAKKGKKIMRDEEVEVRFWDRICVSRVPIEQALRDFEAFKDTKRISQLTVYDSRSLGNIDIHPLEKFDDELLEAIRLFGADKEYFESRKKVKTVFVGPKEIEGVEEDDDDELRF